MRKFFLLATTFFIMVLTTYNTLVAQTVNVTFRVDMQNEIVDPAGVHIAGSFQGWDPAGTPMTNFIGDIWVYTTTLDVGATIEYKFVNGNAWGQDESVPGNCAQNNNRFLTIPANDTTLPANCFGSCLACILPSVNITFQVDMSNETVSPNGVHVAGSFQGWDPAATVMTDQGGGLYAVTLPLDVGMYYEYKFINGNAWGDDESVPPGCAANNNRYYTVPSADEIIPVVCFGSCTACTTVTDINVTFRVDMSNELVDSAGVHIAGSFQGWDPAGTLMTDLGNGIWESSFVLQSGSYHEYKFVNGNAWGMDETVPWYCNQNNNRFLTVPANDTTLPSVCFGSCLVCNPPTSNITFQVDMSLQQISPNGVHITGSFQGWDPSSTAMTDMGNNLYSITLPIGQGEFHEYKFVNGTDFLDAEFVPGACSGVNGNREFFGPVNDSVFDVVCFGECSACVIPTHTFDIHLMLEGPYNGTAMNTDLDAASLIPVNQPYNVAPWNYGGAENIAIHPPVDIVDWVLVELRSTPGDSASATSDRMFHQFAGLLLADGSIVKTDGSSLPDYTGPIFDNLFVVVYHRNHLPVMSSTALVPVGSDYTYDFSTALSQAYLDGQKDLGSGVFGMIGGDSDSDGIIDMNDKDVNWTSETGNAGYYGSDLNMDAQVNNPDKNGIWEPNLGQSSQLPTVAGFSCGDVLIDGRDGQSYNTVMIGTQCWMAENLNFGTQINSLTGGSNSDGQQTDNGTTEKYCYDNTAGNCDTYGGLYQWSEMMEYVTTESPQGICPTDWHVPSDAEWCTLEQEVDPTITCSSVDFRGVDGGGKLKQTGTSLWASPNLGATNSSGFTAVPGGFSTSEGAFGDLTYMGTHWSSTGDVSVAWYRGMSANYAKIARYPNTSTYGYSVRCLKD